MRQTILALTAALALLPALSFASVPPDTLPESFPAVGWQVLDSTELAMLDSTMRGSGAGARPGRYQRDWVGKCGSHVLTRLLPDVSFYNSGVLDIYWTAPAQYKAVALYNGGFYELRSLNKLLVDVGIKFDTSEVPAIAKIAVLWTLMDQHSGNAFALRPDSAALATAIPAVTFRKIERREWRDKWGVLQRAVDVAVVVDARDTEFGLLYERARPSGFRAVCLYRDDQQIMSFR